ncbi:hypothetical protein DL766_003143 [Monosporascus sp. MC13-8B]|nr:hypothetical protein DL763_009826 [Monosporascus cannonballus]RYP34050.1 hypothetical protein DL766_003143 [Monosporascus sp. MC13-8B]
MHRDIGSLGRDFTKRLKLGGVLSTHGFVAYGLFTSLLLFFTLANGAFQAPETANQKRKRGRSTNASRNDDDASKSQLTLTREGKLATTAGNMEEPDTSEEARPRKRGRPAKTDNSSRRRPEPELEPEQSQSPRKKRSRPSISQSQSQSRTNGIAGEGDEGAKQAAVSESAQPKRRGRAAREEPQSAKGAEETAAEEADDENENDGNARLLRRSSRDRRTEGEGHKSPRGSKSRTKRKGAVEVAGPQEELEGDPGLLRRSRRSRHSPSQPHRDSQIVEEQTREATATSKQADKGKRRGRPPVNGGPARETETEPAPKPPNKMAGQPASDSQTMPEAEADADSEEETEPQAQKKRGRRPRNMQRSPSREQGAALHPKKKQGRSSLQYSQNADEEENPPSPQVELKSKDRPPRSKDITEDKSNQKHNPRGRPSKNHDASIQEDPPPKERPSDATAQKPRKHKRPSHQLTQSSPSPSPEPEQPAYRHLATATRRVPRDVIESKWAPLDAASISSVTELLAAASRPVLLRLNNPAKHAHAAAALGAVTNRLRSKLARGLPFPPPPPAHAPSGNGGGGTSRNSREDELEYERTVSAIQGLEAALDPLLHGVELLRREKERAERELEREYRVLATLGANARAQARERRERMRRLHVLVPPPLPERGGYNGTEGASEESSGEVRDGRSVFADLGGDAEVRSLAAQVANHMETMRGNLAQIDGVVPAIGRSRALLSSALLSHLGGERLEDIVLG